MSKTTCFDNNPCEVGTRYQCSTCYCNPRNSRPATEAFPRRQPLPLTEKQYLGFYQHSRAYYDQSAPLKKGVVDEVMFGLFVKEDGCIWELPMRWYKLDKPTPKLEIYLENLSPLLELKDLLNNLQNPKNRYITPDEFCALLLKLGFVDRTKTEQPD